MRLHRDRLPALPLLGILRRKQKTVRIYSSRNFFGDFSLPVTIDSGQPAAARVTFVNEVLLCELGWLLGSATINVLCAPNNDRRGQQPFYRNLG